MAGRLNQMPTLNGQTHTEKLCTGTIINLDAPTGTITNLDAPQEFENASNQLQADFRGNLKKFKGLIFYATSEGWKAVSDESSQTSGEHDIISSNRDKIRSEIGKRRTIVELGAGLDPTTQQLHPRPGTTMDNTRENESNGTAPKARVRRKTRMRSVVRERTALCKVRGEDEGISGLKYTRMPPTHDYIAKQQAVVQKIQSRLDKEPRLIAE
ncbi:hypothetical protein HDV57DRAFT_525591 [Trichoderma longibrachiatum]